MTYRVKNITIAVALALVAAATVWMFTRPDTTDSGEPAAPSQHDAQASEQYARRPADQIGDVGIHWTSGFIT